MAKIYANSLSGKCLEKNHDDIVCMVYNPLQLQTACEKMIEDSISFEVYNEM